MLKSSHPSRVNQCPDLSTHDPSPPAIPQPHYNLNPCPPTTSYAAPITYANTGTSMEYCDLITDPTTKDVWLCSATNELSHLTQGLPNIGIDPTNTIFLSPLTRFLWTNDQPMHVSSAAITLKTPRLTKHA